MQESSDSDAASFPKIFILELTRQCNNRCLYCYTVWGDPCLGYCQDDQGEMSTEEIMEVLDKLQEETQVRSIGISGGEPLLREDLPEILSSIRERGLSRTVITNGTLLTEERSEMIRAGDTFEITLLSHRPEVHDLLAGRRGAWDAAVNGMINVKQAGGNLTAAFIATKQNCKDLGKVVELAIALGANGLMYNRINLGACNMHHVDQLLPTPDMIRENLDLLEEIGERYGLPIVASVVIEPCVIDIRRYKHIHFGLCPLAGENSYFTIDPSGNVRICNHSPVILGNIRHESLKDIFKNPYIRSFRETMPEECSSCNPELKDICRGGCKAAAEQCYGTLARVDPFVTLSRKPGS